MQLIPDLLAEHLEELPGECARRAALLTSDRATIRDLRWLDERIAGRLDAVRLCPAMSLRAVAGAGAADDDLACAAALALTAIDDENAGATLVDLIGQSPSSAAGFARGLVWNHGRPGTWLDALLAAGGLASTLAREALAAHGFAGPHAQAIIRATHADSADQRASAYRACGHARLTRADLRRGGEDGDERVREAATQGAAWCGEPWLLERCRGGRTLGDLRRWALLGTADEATAILARCAGPDFGPERFAVMASLGHPLAVVTLLAAIAGDDPADAVAAGAALSRMLGRAVDSDRLWAPAAIDEADAAFVVMVPLPDPGLARSAWEEGRPRLERARRIAAGQDLSALDDPDALDLLSRREMALRSAYRGEPGPSLAELERLTAQLFEPISDGMRF